MDEFTFDLALWRSRLDARQPQAADLQRFVRCPLGGPFSLVAREAYIAYHREQLDLGTPTPCDVFVWGEGESQRRDGTQVGGLPYRPRGKPWPRRSDGAPMTFLAQFRFAESRDLVGHLPGDVLLVFVEAEFESGQDPIYEWYPLGMDDLATREEIAPPRWRFPTAYGVRHRTLDFPEALERYVDYDEPPEGDTDEQSWRRTELGHCLVVEGTKIGGVPHWIQDSGIEWQRVRGRHLCSLHALGPDMNPCGWPWTNVEAPFTYARGMDLSGKFLNLCDAGALYLFIDDDATITWDFHCY